mgnify:CR=1 FL=1
MEKIVSLLLVLIAVLSLSVTAFAADPIASPVAEEECVIKIVKITATVGGKVQANPVKVKKGEKVELSYDSKNGTFNGISYYVVDKDGKALTDKDGKFIEAKENVDYKIISSGDKSCVVEFVSDIIVCGDYNGKKTNPNTGEPISDDSPETGVNDATAEVVIAVMLLAGAAFVFVAKKREA